MAQYDIFISYKRRGASKSVASRVYNFLTNQGYSVFLDREEMLSGKFDEQLYSNISNAKDIIILFEDDSLKSCFDRVNKNAYKTDWFCLEIIQAIKSKVNIIPILLDNYSFPVKDILPDEIQNIVDFQFVEYDSGLRFEDVYEKILVEKKYLKSKIKRKVIEGIADFLFYSNANCQIQERGEVIFEMTPNNDEDHPYCFPVIRSGEHRFKCYNFDTCEEISLSETIKSGNQKYINVQWSQSQNLWLITEKNITQQNNVDTLYFWGECLFWGNSKHERNLDLSLKCFDKLVELGYPQATDFIKDNCFNTYDNELSDSALLWIQKAANIGFSHAQVHMAILYVNGEKVRKDHSLAFKLFNLAAKQGNIFAHRYLGLCYEQGIGTIKNYTSALKMYNKAAKQGDVTAYINIGDLFKDGYGIKQNFKTALKWYTKATEKGYNDACMSIAYLYCYGDDSLSPNLGEFLKWGLKYIRTAYKTAYKNNQIDIMHKLRMQEKATKAMFYFKTRQYEEAIKYFTILEQLGDDTFTAEYGYCFEQGLGTKKDYKRAQKLYQKAIKEQDNAVAEYNLAKMYEYGHGVKKNLIKAIELYKMAAKKEDNRETPEIKLSKEALVRLGINIE